MFGCLGRMGCLLLLALVAAGAWLTRDRWYPEVFGNSAPEAATADATWQRITPEAADRGRQEIRRLSGARSTGAVTLRPAEAVGAILDSLVGQLPGSERVEAAVIGDRLYLRAEVPLAELGGDVLGPFGAMLNARETLLLGGTLDVVRPGLAQFRVREVKVRDFALPLKVVPRLLRELRRGAPVPEGVAEDAVPLTIPRSVGAVHLSMGRVAFFQEVRP